MAQFLNSSRLPVTTSVSGGDLIPVFVQDSGITMASALSTLNTYFQSLLNPVNYFQQVFAVPVTGATVTAPQVSTNLWFVIQPAGTIATLTLALPANGVAIDGQTVSVSSSQTITTMTITASGSTVLDTPSTQTINIAHRLRYCGALNSWFNV